MPFGWQHRLNTASTQAGVAMVARDFVAQFSAAKLLQLPAVCRPGTFLDAHDVIAYSFLIVRHHRDGGAPAAAFVHRLARFFSSASIRLSQPDLLMRPVPRGADRRLALVPRRDA